MCVTVICRAGVCWARAAASVAAAHGLLVLRACHVADWFSLDCTQDMHVSADLPKRDGAKKLLAECAAAADEGHVGAASAAAHGGTGGSSSGGSGGGGGGSAAGAASKADDDEAI